MSNSTYCDDHYERPWWSKRIEDLERQIKELKTKIPSEDKVELTDIHYARMKHALGMDNKEPEDGVYEAYRNGSIYDSFNDIWEDLVRGGYANRIYGGTDIRYSVTRKGMQAVSDETGLLIRYELEFEPKKK